MAHPSAPEHHPWLSDTNASLPAYTRHLVDSELFAYRFSKLAAGGYDVSVGVKFHSSFPSQTFTPVPEARSRDYAASIDDKAVWGMPVQDDSDREAWLQGAFVFEDRGPVLDFEDFINSVSLMGLTSDHSSSAAVSDTDFEAHSADRASCENSPNHATSDLESVDDGVKNNVARSPGSYSTADEFDEVTDEEIRAMREVIAAQKLKTLKIRIPATQKQGRGPTKTSTTKRRRAALLSNSKSPAASLSPTSPLSPSPGPARKKSRGRPKKTPVRPVTPPPPLTSCPLFIEVKADPVVVKGRNGAIKYQEQAPHILGPCTLSFGMPWDEFLPFLATRAYATSAACLVIDTMLWRFCANHTAKSDSLPLTNEEGFKYMISHVKASPLQASGSLFIKMARPTKGEEQLPPWAAKATPAVQPVLDDVATPAASKKSISLDDKLLPYVRQLRDTYPEGLCDIHPQLRCFHHAPTDWHFELTEKREKVWAFAMLKQQTDLTVPPLGSPFFKKDQTIKSTGTHPAPMTPQHHAPLTVPQPVTPIHPPIYHPYSMPPYVMPPSPWAPYGMYPSAPPMAPTPSTSHAPSSPIMESCTLDEFCDQTGLGDRERDGLEKLGYQVGDRLHDIEKEDIREAGFRPCDWSRVLRAEKKYRLLMKTGKRH
ncbi:hypothetical protein BU15DRAFT_78901 [Melanogaster broomeanus]|nr:hypothetical protein BU15DRAFT_78901 [Melanogaster broomeanus]